MRLKIFSIKWPMIIMGVIGQLYLSATCFPFVVMDNTSFWSSRMAVLYNENLNDSAWEDLGSRAGLWNGAGANFVFYRWMGKSINSSACNHFDGYNTMAFKKSFCGRGFGDALAITYVGSRRADGTFKDTDLIFNGNRSWASYDGPIDILDAVYGKREFRRTALHELGHIVGLGHPILGNSIMKKRYTLFTYTLQQDDTNGIRWLYNRKFGLNLEVSGFISRLFEFPLFMPPDDEGLKSWTDFSIRNQEIKTATEAFFLSQTFSNYIIDYDLYVRTLYKTALNREPDPYGINDWVKQLQDGIITLENAMDGFLNSQEFGGLNPFTKGGDVTTNIKEFVTRLYQVVLGRPPDPSGLNYWINKCLTTGEVRTATKGFLLSPEFLSKVIYREAFVTALYRVVLNREPNPGELSHWTNQLNSFPQSYKHIIGEFLNSVGFQNIDPFR